MKAARVLIADDHEITRLGVRTAFESAGHFEFCGDAGDGHAVLQKTQHFSPDLVVLDLGLPRLNGLEAARQILVHSPQTSVLIFTELDSEQPMRKALQLGIKAYVLKSDPLLHLVAAADAVLQGRTFYTSRMTHMILNGATQGHDKPLLTPREREIVQLLVEGHTAKEVATMLCVSIKTVETHRTKIMRKLDVNSTARLILCAVRNELVYLPSIMCAPAFSASVCDVRP